MTVGDRIKTEREKKGFTQVELARKAKISKQTLYKYETNIVTNIPSDKIEKLSEILQISPCYLMGWSEREENKKNRDVRLEKIIKHYNGMNNTGKDSLAEQAEFLHSKHPLNKTNERVI